MIRWPTSAVTGVWTAAASPSVVVIGVEPMKPSTLIAVHVSLLALVIVPLITIGPWSGM